MYNLRKVRFTKYEFTDCDLLLPREFSRASKINDRFGIGVDWASNYFDFELSVFMERKMIVKIIFRILIPAMMGKSHSRLLPIIAGYYRDLH